LYYSKLCIQHQKGNEQIDRLRFTKYLQISHEVREQQDENLELKFKLERNRLIGFFIALLAILLLTLVIYTFIKRKQLKLLNSKLTTKNAESKEVNELLRVKNDKLEELIETLKNTEASLMIKRLALNELLNEKQLILDSAGVGIALLKDRKFVWVNKGFEEIYGYSHSELIEKTSSVLYPDIDSFNKIGFEAKTQFKEQAQFFSECQMLHKSESKFWASIRGNVVDHNNEEKGVLWIVEDITAQKEQRDQLKKATLDAREAVVAKGDFLANMSHEIRTPLNAITGYQFLLEQTEINKIQNDYLLKSKRSAQHLLEVINTILDYSKLESGQVQLENTEFSINRLINDVGDIGGNKSHDKKLDFLITNNIIDNPTLLGDSLKLKQVLINLINNSLKFTEKGDVQLIINSAFSSDDRLELEISVQDTGIGIEENQIDNLFKSFTQADTTITRKYGGTGLGLSISYQYLKMMGSVLNVKSKIGKGSNFFFKLSLPIVAITPDIEKYVFPEGISKLKTILVSNDNLSAKIIEKYLNQLNLSCLRVELIEEATTLMAKENFDIVLLENSPDFKYLTVIKESFNKLSQQPKYILINSFPDPEIIQNAYESGFSDVLIKPLNTSILFDKIVNIFFDEHQNKKQIKRIQTELNNKVQGSKVLVVDDNEINLEIIQEILKTNGITVTTADSGFKCINLLKQKNDYDIILMDIQMPVMDGISVTRMIRNNLKLKKMPIIALTADINIKTKEKAIRLGMNDFVTKPINVLELFKVLNKYISTKIIKDISNNDIINAKKGLELTKDTKDINISEGLRRVSGNIIVYNKVVNNFIRKYLNYFNVEQANLDLETLSNKLHNYKGVCGNLGFSKLYKKSIELEQIISTKEELPIILAKIKSLNIINNETIEYLSTIVNNEHQESNNSSLIIELKSTFEKDNITAKEFFDINVDAFDKNLIDNFNELQFAFDTYDFEAVKQILNSISIYN